MRVRKKPWAEKEISTNQYVVTDPDENKGKWKEFFGNNNDIYVEIGCGKGGFISKMGQTFPTVNFIGIERQKYIIAPALRRIGSDNIRLIWGDVSNINDYFSPGEIKRIYINFCDPWPKKKWAKRRLTHRGFLTIYKHLFGLDGKIFFKTDNRELFEFSLGEFSQFGFELSNITFDLHNSGYTDNVTTEYEKKFMLKGMPIYRCEADYKMHLSSPK